MVEGCRGKDNKESYSQLFVKTVAGVSVQSPVSPLGQHLERLSGETDKYLLKSPSLH